jgi:hypothetical protein
MYLCVLRESKWDKHEYPDCIYPPTAFNVSHGDRVAVSTMNDDPKFVPYEVGMTLFGIVAQDAQAGQPVKVYVGGDRRSVYALSPVKLRWE